MDAQDRKAIEDLFGKLQQVERQGQPRDPEAETLIREKLAAIPGAAYYMSQAIVVQEHALRASQERIADLERQVAERPAGGGFLSGLFGGGQTAGARPQSRSAVPSGLGQPFGGPRAGGGFLAGAAQTAMGVAGGVLLGNAIAGFFGGDDRQAQAQAQPAEAAQPEEPSVEPAADEGGAFDSFFGNGADEI